MQHAVSRENLQRPVVHSHRTVLGYFFVGIFQVLVDALFEAELLGSFFKTRFCVLVDVHLFWCGRSLRHSGLSTRSSRAFAAQRISRDGWHTPPQTKLRIFPRMARQR